MKEDKVICEIHSMKDGVLDNDYTFYESGKILHLYDRNSFKLNIEEWVTPDQISDKEKQRLINECPEEFQDFVQNILYPE